MVIQHTTYGIFMQVEIDPSYSTGPSISKDEQIKKLSALKSVKGMREKKQYEIAKK